MSTKKLAETIQVMLIENTARGEFVRKVTKIGFPLKTVWIRGDYDKSTKTYSLTSCEDVNREIFVKRGTKVLVGFTY